MLFYSYEFILLYLPAVLAGFFLLARSSTRLAAAWLALASLFFYGFWNPQFLLLIMASITFNYAMGYSIARRREQRSTRGLLAVAIVVNLAALGYFKYTNFFIATADAMFGTHWSFAEIALPLGISIFTFTQIAFVCDVYRGVAREYNFIHYVLFVTYFPHLIAGPIIHHQKVMPQFDDARTYLPRAENFAVGLVIFAIGLAKKVLLASSFAEYSDPVFQGVANGVHPGLLTAWMAAIAYALQIYFDFSGYSDMAIGLSRLFGITLPENFNSPYRATSIIEFWRRWNMTLSRFLRDYLYVPLGGNRKGPARRYVNLLLTMLLGGLWHGASWTFVAWGALHGAYLIVNHAWVALTEPLGAPTAAWRGFGRVVCTGLTFLAVVVAWVYFRADSFESAHRILLGMMQWRDVVQWWNVPAMSGSWAYPFWIPQDVTVYRIGLFAIGLGIVWFAPNTQALVSRVRFSGPAGSFATVGACAFWILLLAAISASREMSQFIYFNF